MTNGRGGIGVLRLISAVMGVSLLSGCAPVDGGSFASFLAELLRNVGAALLL